MIECDTIGFTADALAHILALGLNNAIEVTACDPSTPVGGQIHGRGRRQSSLVPGNDRDVALAVERNDAVPGFDRIVQHP